MAISEKDTKGQDVTRRGGDLFIVDNSANEWIGKAFKLAINGAIRRRLLEYDGDDIRRAK